MNCEKYREAIAADPSESFDDGASHAAGCEACSRYRDGMRVLDARIARALAIDVPPLELPELPPADVRAGGEVVDFPARRSGKSALPAWFGIAAGVLVAVFAVLEFSSPGPVQPSLAEQVIAHMDYEQDSRRVTSVAVSTQSLGEVIDSDVSRMDGNLGLVTYAHSCVINGHTVPHLVIQGRNGPVTLILMPDETIDGAIPLAGESVHGVIVPVGSGSVAIIGERAEQLDEIGEIGDRIAESVNWRI